MPVEQYACGYCTAKFRWRDEQRRHRQEQHPTVTRPGRCAVCNTSCDNFFRFFEHFNIAHPTQNKIVCRAKYGPKRDQSPLVKKLFMKVDKEIRLNYHEESNLIALLDKALATRTKHHDRKKAAAALQRKPSNAENVAPDGIKNGKDDDEIITEKVIPRNPTLPPFVLPVKQEKMSQEIEGKQQTAPVVMEPAAVAAVNTVENVLPVATRPVLPLAAPAAKPASYTRPEQSPKRSNIDRINTELKRRAEKRQACWATAHTIPFKSAAPADPFKFVEELPLAPAAPVHVYALGQQLEQPPKKKMAKPTGASATVAREVENAPPVANQADRVIPASAAASVAATHRSAAAGPTGANATVDMPARMPVASSASTASATMTRATVPPSPPTVFVDGAAATSHSAPGAASARAAAGSSSSTAQSSGVILTPQSSRNPSSSSCRYLPEERKAGLQRAVGDYFDRYAVPMAGGSGAAAAARPETLSERLQAVMPAAAPAAAAAPPGPHPPAGPAPPAPALLSIDAPFAEEIDRRYWTFCTEAKDGLPAFPAGSYCPRGCGKYFRTDSKQSRMLHYKKVHPNRFYLEQGAKQWSQNDKSDERFLAFNFGDYNNTGRCCVLCEGKLRTAADHESRLVLAKHVAECHTAHFIIIKQDYLGIQREKRLKEGNQELHKYLLTHIP